MSNRYDVLFEPVQIGPKTAPNRFFAVPHATGHSWAQPMGEIAIRAMKAEGGWGTVAVQMTEISGSSDMGNHPMQRLWDDTDISRHVAQVDAIQSHGSLAAIELAHGGMRARNFVTMEPVLGPSDLPVLRPEVPIQARAMDLSDIATFRQSHKDAVKRSIQAGYDIVYVYAAHDLSLMSHFLSVRTNQRTDAYGGSFENRLRLLREVLEDTLEVADGKCAVAIRFSVDEPEKSVGLHSDGEGRDVVEALGELPDLWDVNIAGWPSDSATARFSEEGHQLPFTDFVKSVTSKPVVGVGRFTSPDRMVSLIRSGKLDLIGAARPSIADPFLPSKLRDGREDEIRECIGCNICVSMDGYGVPIRCTQNPTISEEWRRDWHPEIVSSKGKSTNTLIVGGGPAGMECARLLAVAGQKVTLAEASSALGGRVRDEARLPGLATWNRVHDYRNELLTRSPNVDVFCESQLSADNIAEFDADKIVLATGSKWRRDGVGSMNMDPLAFNGTDLYSPDDIMSGARPVKGPVVVYDDDHFYMGSVLAELLANEGHSVSYVTPHPMIAAWTDMNLDQGPIIERLAKLGVEMHPNTKMQSGPIFTSLLSRREMIIEFESLVFVGARAPRNELVTGVQKMVDPENILVIGDCYQPGTIQAAVYSGHQTARLILGQSQSPKRDHPDHLRN